MTRQPIPIQNFTARPHQLWAEQWMLLTAGDFAQKRFNTMTVAWGSFGTMWNKPFAHIVVRPGRYTYEFTEKFDTNYPAKDYHTIYYGEILAVQGASRFVLS